MMDQGTMAAAAAAMTAAGQGEARWWFGGLCEIKLTAAQTGGALTVLEITDPPNESGPLHVHHREDEGFWLLEGSATFEVGGETFEAGAGDLLWGPRGVPHRFSTGPDGVRMLFLFTPGGFEDLVLATSVPAQERALPPAGLVHPDEAAFPEVVQRFGCEILG